MSVASTAVWEVRTTGNSANGGGFNSAASGTDYSQQDAAQKSGSDLAIHASDNTKVQPVAAGVSAADIGNLIQIASGTGFTVGIFEITAQDGTYWTLDRATGTVSSTAGVYKMGGALNGIGRLANNNVAPYPVGGNIIWIKTGTYNVAASQVFGTIGGIDKLTLQGYSTTRGDSGKATFFATAGSITLLQVGGQSRVKQIITDGNNQVAVRGIYLVSTQSDISDCEAYRCKAAGIYVTNSNRAVRCYVAECDDGGSGPGSTNTPFLLGDGPVIDCVSYNNTGAGFAWSNTGSAHLHGCIAWGNTGAGFAKSDSSSQSVLSNCVAYANGGSGFHQTHASSSGMELRNCISYGNSGYGRLTATTWLRPGIGGYNAYGANTSGALSGAPADLGDTTLTVNPFVNAAAGNFALNNVSGGGAALRAAGFNSFPIISTVAYRDVGAVQHRSSLTDAEIAEAAWTYANRTLTA